jgi:peptide/nickel transport system permease protein
MSASSPVAAYLLRRAGRPRSETRYVPSPTARAVLWRAVRSPSARLGLLLLLGLGLLAALAPVLSTHDPAYLEPARRLLPPSRTHWLGTDDLGRDVFTRLAHGARISLLVGLAVSATSVVAGTILGLVASSHRGADAVLMRGADGLLAFPGVLLGIAIVVRLGGTMSSVLLALSLVYTPLVARLVRTTTLAAQAQPHVEAARALGAGPVRLMTRHVLPTAISPLLAQWSFIAGLAVLSEASLSFLGASVTDAATWGAVLRDGQRLLATAWWIAVPAGLALTATVLACTLVGDGLRDAFDPRMQVPPRRWAPRAEEGLSHRAPAAPRSPAPRRPDVGRGRAAGRRTGASHPG